MAAIITPGQPVLEEQQQAQPQAAPKPPVYGKGQYQGAPSPDFNKIQDGNAVEGMDGYSWYHTGSRGGSGAFGGSDWIQAQTGSLPGAGQPGGGAATPQTVQQAFQTNLQKLLGGPSPDEAGANLDTSPQAVAYRNAQQRAYDREAQQLAEDNAVGGGMVDSQGLAMAQRGLRQQRGESEGQFMADLSTQRTAQRREELIQAMGMAQAMGDNEQARQVQLEIARIDAATRNNATNVNAELGRGDLDLRKLLGLEDINLRRYGIDNQLAYDYTDLAQRGNQAAIETLLL